MIIQNFSYPSHPYKFYECPHITVAILIFFDVITDKAHNFEFMGHRPSKISTSIG